MGCMSTRVALAAGVLALLASCAGKDAEPEKVDIPGLSLVERGEIAADRMCAFCHQVRPERPASVEAAAPSFMEIANAPGRNREYLRQFTGEEHLVETLGPQRMTMPTTLLSPEEREEVIAYLLSFQKDPETGRQPFKKLEAFE
jgi:Cytochrome c